MGKFIKTIELTDAILDFYEGYLISTIKEDVLFEDYHVEQILRIADEVYEHSPYVYISNRKENYNVNPTIYFSLKNQNFLKGIAIVSYKDEGLKIAHFEKQFSPLDFEIFENLEEAKAWSQRLLKEKKQACKPDSVTRRGGFLIIYLRFLLPKTFSCLPSGSKRAVCKHRFTWHCTA